MEHSELVALLRPGVPASGGTWADLGSGTGNFTAALRELLPAPAVIYAVDRDARSIATVRARWQAAPVRSTLIPVVADITKTLDLPPVDGMLLANVLHFLHDQRAVLRHLVGYLRPGGRLLLVEYDLAAARSYVPFPIPSALFPTLALSAGLVGPRLLATRRSPSSGTTMYSAMAVLGEVGQDRAERHSIEGR